jgi:hypothetical protein
MSSLSKDVVSYLQQKLASNNSSKAPGSRRSSLEYNYQATDNKDSSMETTVSQDDVSGSNGNIYEYRQPPPLKSHLIAGGGYTRKASASVNFRHDAGNSKTGRRHSMPETLPHSFGLGAGNLDTIDEVIYRNHAVLAIWVVALRPNVVLFVNNMYIIINNSSA